MAAAIARALDVKEPQILRHYPADPGGFFWHHRVLLEKTAPGVWVAVTPDGDLERVDLNTVAHITLDRRADFPAPQSPYIYAFVPIPRSDLKSYHRRAKVMANLFNDAGVADVEAYEWVIADTSRGDFGSTISEDIVDADGVVLRDSAIVEVEGEEIYCVRIPSASKAEWILGKEASKGDLRLLGDFRDGQGKRYLEFWSGVTKMRNSQLEDWPLSGPRAVMEFLSAVREGGTDLAAYHLNWCQNSGVSHFSAAVHEHRVLTDMLRVGISTDQLDLSNLLMAELGVRRLIQIEMAVSKNASSPDYSGLDLVMEQPVGVAGQAVTMGFNNWVAGKLKERANIQKQARLDFSRRSSAALAVQVPMRVHVYVDVGGDEAPPKPRPKPVGDLGRFVQF